MSITNIKSENRKAIILSFQDCFIGKINKDEIYDYCENNNIEISKYISFNKNYDTDTLCQLIETINYHDKPSINPPIKYPTYAAYCTSFA